MAGNLTRSKKIQGNTKGYRLSSYSLPGVQVAQIIKPFPASILRDHHPLPSGIRQTNIGLTIE